MRADVNVCDFRFGCFPNENSRGLTPWHYAIFSKNTDLLDVLLNSGALPDVALLQQPEFNRQYQAMKRPSNIDGGLPLRTPENSEHIVNENPDNHTNEESDSLAEPPAKRARIS